MYSLVIIDMQTKFGAAHKPELKKTILREIEQAKKNDRLIINISFNDCGQTKRYITKALKDYYFSFDIEKWQNDGSQVIKKSSKTS